MFTQIPRPQLLIVKSVLRLTGKYYLTYFCKHQLSHLYRHRPLCFLLAISSRRFWLGVSYFELISSFLTTSTRGKNYLMYSDILSPEGNKVTPSSYFVKFSEHVIHVFRIGNIDWWCSTVWTRDWNDNRLLVLRRIFSVNDRPRFFSTICKIDSKEWILPHFTVSFLHEILSSELTRSRISVVAGRRTFSPFFRTFFRFFPSFVRSK